ncbi:coiled-coil domain-containing protein 17 isoform X1 [Carassius auratus]|uniref:Coiled-coil domain-containing protein 17 isoform X1 n=1 Tax=Carassius auratus TaxID=7957 RepID=A0A6P6KAP9_CARAU|nr:coiled-coil domain-containing protein 17 isoform X1 [Carassius auratus]
MEGLGDLICHNCKMAFHSKGLLDKHKAKFCIGTDLKDPVPLWRGQRGFTQKERAAVKTVHPTRTRTPDLIILKEQRNHERESGQDNVSENTALNKLTEEFQKLRISFEQNLPRRQTEVSEEQASVQQRADEHRALHEQRLAEIRARNRQLEKQREEIEERLAELAGRERTAHLEEALQELRNQEQRNEDVLQQLSSHINSMKGPKPFEVPSNPPEEKKTQHITFDLISSVAGPLSAQIRALRLAYMQSGGSDPEVLAHMHDLQTEALTLEQTKHRAESKIKGRRMRLPHRVLDPDVLAVEQENQRLEEEILRIQLAREKHKGEHGFTDIQKDHFQQMASLQVEIAFLRREKEKDRERRAPLSVFPGSSMALTHLDLPLDQSSKQHSLMGSHITDPLEAFGPAPYDPVAGFVIFYDLVMGVEATLRTVRLLAGLYFNGQKLGQTTPMPPVLCQPTGPLLSNKSPGNYALLAVTQPVPRVQPTSDLSLVIEIQTSEGLDLFNHETEGLVTCGWTKLDLFDQHNQVNSGHWRLPFRAPPVQASLSPGQLNSVQQLGNMELCLRVANARDGDKQTLEEIDPNNTNQYKSISMVASNTVLANQEPC